MNVIGYVYRCLLTRVGCFLSAMISYCAETMGCDCDGEVLDENDEEIDGEGNVKCMPPLSAQ